MLSKLLTEQMGNFAITLWKSGERDWKLVGADVNKHFRPGQVIHKQLRVETLRHFTIQ